MHVTNHAGPIRNMGRALMVLVIVLIALATLTPGSVERLEPTDITCLVCGSNGMADVVRNLLLFSPLGAACALAGVRWRTAVATGFLLSLSVEAMQYAVVVGRDPSLSDLLTNSSGTALGHALIATWRSWATPTPLIARRLLGVGLVAWGAILGGTAIGLQWDAPPLPYFTDTAPPRVAGVREYEGVVHSRTLDGQPVDSRDAGAALLRDVQRGRLEVGAEVGVMYPPGLLRPVVGYYTQGWTGVLAFGQQRRDLVLTLRTRAQRARLVGPRWVLHDVFPDLETSNSAAGRAMRMTLHGSVNRSTVTLSARGGAADRSVELGRRLALGWTFFLPSLALLYRSEWLVSALWLAGPLLPLGYWMRRAVPDGQPGSLRLAGLVAVGMVALVLVVGKAGGLAPPSAIEWATLAGAGMAGWWLGGGSISRPGEGQP